MQTEKIARLRVKVISLGIEGAVIHRDELRYRRTSKHPKTDEQRRTLARDAWLSLRDHRKFVLRPETRSANLAYGFLRGTSYLAIERKCWHAPDWERVASLIKRFSHDGTNVTAETLIAWSKESHRPSTRALNRVPKNEAKRAARLDRIRREREIRRAGLNAVADSLSNA